MKQGFKAPPHIGLLIVDVQKGFIKRGSGSVIPIVENLQQCYSHVFATRFINSENSPHRKFIPEWENLYPGTPEIELEFTKADHVKVIDKTIYSCINNDFLAYLQDLGIKEMHICGIDTDVCVSMCATDLFQNKIRPVVIKDACASSGGKKYHKAGLFTLRRLIGEKQLSTCSELEKEYGSCE